jgi:hypothetical protein
MAWKKGIKQLHTANRILEGIVFEITDGNIESTKEVQKRIKYVQRALEDANNHFSDEKKNEWKNK